MELELTKEASIAKRYKIKSVQPQTHAAMKSTIAQLGLPDLESMVAKKGHLIGFCLLTCSSSSDMMPFEMDADPSTHKFPNETPESLTQHIITVINNGEKYMNKKKR